MEQDTEYSWDTNKWINNNKGNPMWQIWSNPISPDDINEEIDVNPTLPTLFLENINVANGPISTHVLTDSQLLLPPSPVRICKNSFGHQKHLVLSLLAHILIWIIRVGIHKIR